MMSLLACLALAAGGGPNVLLVVFDDVSQTDMDYVPTPTFDSLRGQGLEFRRAYASPVCSTARQQLYLGSYAYRRQGSACLPSPGIAPLDLGQTFLPEVFEAQDYATALFGKLHMGRVKWQEPPVDAPWELAGQWAGFETWRAGVAGNIGQICDGEAGGGYSNWIRVDDGVSMRSSVYQTDAVRDEFLAWHAAQTGSWFAMVSFQAPHSPFHSPPGVNPKPIGKRAKYEQMLIAADAAMGTMLAAVDLSQTVVIITADNGTPPDATLAWQDPDRVKFSTYEDGIKVPFLMVGSGVPQGVQSQSLISFVDIMPTLAALAGCPPIATNQVEDGVCFLPILYNQMAEVRSYVFAGFVNEPTGYETGAIVTRRWKYLEDHGVPELYDLALDPGETVNESGNPAIAELEAGLAALLALHYNP